MLKIMWDWWMPVFVPSQCCGSWQGCPFTSQHRQREVKLAQTDIKGHVCQPFPIILSIAPFPLNVSPVLMCKIFERISLEDSACHEAVWLKITIWQFLICSWGFSYSFRWSMCSRWVMIINAVCFLNKQHWPSLITCPDPISVVIPESTKKKKKSL